MPLWRPVSSFSRSAMRAALRASATGAAVTLLSTVVSCTIAVAIERSANRTMYRFFPHWYTDVQSASGLPNLQQDRYHVAARAKEAADDRGDGAVKAETFWHDSEGEAFRATTAVLTDKIDAEVFSVAMTG